MRGWDILHDDLVMEIAVLIECADDYNGNRVSDYHLPWGSVTNGLEHICGQLKPYMDKGIEYVYFGNEFCEYKIPTIDQLKRMLDICKTDGILCVLVTPVVSDYGINKLSDLIDCLINNSITIPVVINDMGVFELIKRKKYSGECIVGRILEKSNHDCRASREEFDNYYGENGKKFAKTPGIISDYSKMIFDGYGVDRYEFDLPKVGFELPIHGNYSLYWPYSYLTTGRVCMFRSLDLSGRDKFLVGDVGCGKLCTKYKVEKRKPINGYLPEKKAEMFLFQKGNTVYFINDDVDLNLEYFNRLIIQL